MPYASLQQIAHVLKLTPRMVNLHVKDHGMPRVSRGEYDLVQCVHWYIDYKDQLIKEARRGDESEQQARARLVKATANLRELELARARREVIPVATVQIVWERIVVSFKTKVLSIPTKLPQRLVACKDINQIKDLLEREIGEALNELSKAEIDISEDGDFEEAPPAYSQASEPTAEAYSESMVGLEPDVEPGVKRRTRSMENGPS
jgi:phage terminase Nu1 subunit (DNA packaging protein)